MNTNYCFKSFLLRPPLWDLRVLIVNPVLSTANAVVFSLESFGAKGIAVENFDQALTISQAFHPNVLITKLNSSNLNHHALLDKIKKLKVTNESQILGIVLTDFPWMLDQNCALTSEFQYHLFDVLDTQNLASNIKQIIQEKYFHQTKSKNLAAAII